jgi:dipeptidyl aminopeptidase/acylaminoacyl peptidase
MAATGHGTSRRGWVVSGLALGGGLAALAYGVASYVVYDALSRAPRACWPRDAANTPASFVVPDGVDGAIAAANRVDSYEDVRFPSRDPAMAAGRLAGWWIPADDPGAPAVVLVHGIQSCRREANVLVPAAMLHRAGFSVLLMDLRDHGDSDGDDGRFAGGSEEYLDVLGAWDWVRSQGVAAERIGLLGMSFGAVTAIIAGGHEAGVAAVWADSAPPRTAEAIGLFTASQLRDPTGLSKLLVPGALLWARITAGDDLARFEPIEEVRAFRDRSIAFVHGELDAVLPARFAAELRERAIASGASSPDAWVVPGAGHTGGVYVDPAGYEARLVAFFTAALGTP